MVTSPCSRCREANKGRWIVGDHATRAGEAGLQRLGKIKIHSPSQDMVSFSSVGLCNIGVFVLHTCAPLMADEVAHSGWRLTIFAWRTSSRRVFGQKAISHHHNNHYRTDHEHFWWVFRQNTRATKSVLFLMHCQMKFTFNFNNWPAVVASILAIILMSSTPLYMPYFLLAILMAAYIIYTSAVVTFGEYVEAVTGVWHQHLTPIHSSIVVVIQPPKLIETHTQIGQTRKPPTKNWLRVWFFLLKVAWKVGVFTVRGVFWFIWIRIQNQIETWNCQRTVCKACSKILIEFFQCILLRKKIIFAKNISSLKDL